MSTVQIPWRFFALALGAWLVLPAAAPAAAPTKEEVAETAKWFETLQWPDLKGKPYVEIVFGKFPRSVDSPDGKAGKEELVDGSAVWGFLLGEDKSSYTVFLDGVVPRYVGEYQGRPFAVQRIDKRAWDTDPKRAVVLHRRELSAAVDGALAAARQSSNKKAAEKPGEFEIEIPPKVSPMVALFGLARWCALTGHADFAQRLDDALPELDGQRMWLHQAGKKPFREVVESEVSSSLMLQAKAECAERDVKSPFDHPVPRSILEAEFARIAREFPASADHDEAARIAEELERMVVEDGKHPPIDDKAWEKMSREDQAQELIFQLRDQVYQRSYGMEPEPPSQVEQLVQLGYAAVPALIETLGDPRLTRSVSRPYAGGDYYGPIITVGDCAVDALSQIANRNFGFDENKDPVVRADRADDLRRAVESWWKGVRNHGEEAMLIQSVRAGGDDSPEKARRLAEVDPEALVEALLAGLDATKNDTAREALFDLLAQIKTEAATEALRREMRQGKDSRCRAASALEIFYRGAAAKEAVSAMIAELGKPLPKRHYDPDLWPDDPGRLIEFLGRCGDLAAMKALASRLPQLTPDLRGVIVESMFPKEPPPKPIPAEVEALAEKIAVSALDDRALAFEPWPPELGNSGGIAPEAGGPRVCDLAAAALARRWPERYPLKEAPAASTRLERDAQYAAFRNTWRVAQGMQPLPVTARPSSPAARENANVIAEFRWISAKPVAGFPKRLRQPADSSYPFPVNPKKDFAMRVGEPLTGRKFLMGIEQLEQSLGDEYLGIAVSAERLGDRRGIVIEIEPLGHRPVKVHKAGQIVLSILPRRDFSLSTISNGQAGAKWADGTGDGGAMIFHDDQRAAEIDAALKADPAATVGIYFQGVVGQ